MKHFGGERYNSRWDWFTWFISGLIAVYCVATCFLNDGIWPVIISCASFIFVLLVFVGTFYKIDGNMLVVYSFFVPTAYPINKIKEIRPTKSVLSAPATSLTGRLAITFTDRMILKSSIPLIISPVRQDSFIQQLKEINPGIIT